MEKKHKAMEYHNTRSNTYRLTAHYLFDLGYPAETVAEIVGMDVDYVRGVAEFESRYRV